MGVPGDPQAQTDYVIGWEKGLNTILVTPLIGLVLFFATIFRKKLVPSGDGGTILNITFSLSVLGSIWFIYSMWSAFATLG